MYNLFIILISFSMDSLVQACSDILIKNMEYNPSDILSWEKQEIYFLYDTESPLAKILSDAWIKTLPSSAIIREFLSPPQPLYRGWLVNPENPYTQRQNRVITSHNITENIQIWLDHHEKFELKNEEILILDPQVEEIKNELTSLSKWSIVILVQSTNFRLSTFRIRLELFHRGIHVVEHNHLAYIPESQFPTFYNCLMYRTDEYVRLQKVFYQLAENAETTRIQSVNGDILTFWPLEKIRGNTGDYSRSENKWWTFPIGETFTEATNLRDVNGYCLIDTFPNEDFSIAIVEPFRIEIRDGRVFPSPDFPSAFRKLYDWVVQYEWEVLVRELGFGLNPALSTTTPLSDINFHERKVGVHLSLGKKHGIYGKKLPKTEVQRFHIDVFVALESVFIGEEKIFEKGKWIT